MAKVIFVKSVPTKKRVQIGVDTSDGAFTYTVSEATYKSLGSPEPECFISESDVGTLSFDDGYCKAFEKAYGYLSVSDKSKYELKLKLMRAGFSSEISDAALDRLDELGYIDEDRQLERAVEREANYNLRGRHYIKRKLAGKGYSISAINRAIAALVERGDVDFDVNFERLAEKKCASTYDDRRALEYKFGYKI